MEILRDDKGNLTTAALLSESEFDALMSEFIQKQEKIAARKAKKIADGFAKAFKAAFED